MIILDTSALLSLCRSDDPQHNAVADVIASDEIRIVSPFVVAELDYIILSRFGVRVELAVLSRLSSGQFELPTMTAGDLITCERLLRRFAEHPLGVTDASLVILADRYGTDRICTLDRRHFSILRTLDGQPFTLLP